MCDERKAYERALYAKSPRWRLKVINYQRGYRGLPDIESLDDMGEKHSKRGPNGQFVKAVSC